MSEHKMKTYPNGKKKKLPYKRRKRGKCVYCDSRNTAYYCPSCPPKKHANKHWVCGPPVDWNQNPASSHAKCQKAHQRAQILRLQKEEDEKSVE